MNIEKITQNWESDYKMEILEIIDNNFNDKGLSNLVKWLENDIDYNGALTEVADSKIDIMYCDLRRWAVDNYGYIEEAVNEFGIGEKFDFHKVIQMGQYLMYSQDLSEAVNELVDHIKDNYKIV